MIIKVGDSPIFNFFKNLLLTLLTLLGEYFKIKEEAMKWKKE